MSVVGFADGAELIVITLLAEILEDVWNLETWEKGFLGTAPYIGFVIGGISSGPLADKLSGRKYLIIASVFSTFIIGIICTFVNSFWLFIIVRGTIGITIGIIISTEKTYLIELLPS